jgi:hypothetical protein
MSLHRLMDMNGTGMMDHMTETPMMPMDGMNMMGGGDTGMGHAMEPISADGVPPATQDLGGRQFST